MGESNTANGNGGGQVSATVLQTVLDKFLTLTEQTSQSSSGMANAIETMASNITEMTEHLNALEQQIAEEQLGAVLTESVGKIKESIAELKKTVDSGDLNQLAFLVEMCKHLSYQKHDPKVVAEGVVKLINQENQNQDNMTWALDWIGWVRANFYKICFLAGGLVIWMYLKAGVDTVGYIRTWFGG